MFGYYGMETEFSFSLHIKSPSFLGREHRCEHIVSVVHHSIELRALQAVRLFREDPRVYRNLRSVSGGSLIRLPLVCNVDSLKIVLPMSRRPEFNLHARPSTLTTKVLLKEVEVRPQVTMAGEPLLDWNRRFDNPAEHTPIVYIIKNKKYKLVKLLLQTR